MTPECFFRGHAARQLLPESRFPRKIASISRGEATLPKLLIDRRNRSSLADVVEALNQMYEQKPLSNAEKQRRWRERRKAELVRLRNENLRLRQQLKQLQARKHLETSEQRECH